jgi:hypothetical protein
MGRSVAKLALFMLFGATCVHGQVPGMPMGGVEQPDTSRIRQEEMHHASAPSGPLKIAFGKKQVEWAAAAFASLPHSTITVYNQHAKTNQTYSGVPLIDLLTSLGVPAKPQSKDFRLYVVAEGSDGYQVVYSIGEITPDVHDGTVLVADAMDGKPLGNNGLFQLVATGEKRPARWVRNLVAIRVLTAQ